MIRKLQQNEIPDALALVREVFNKYEAPDYSPEGIKTFFDFLEDKAQIDILIFYGAFTKDNLIGVIAMRGEVHVAMFFVKGEFHRQGFGRKLFEFALQNSTAERVTVNSSPYAAEVYHRLGFTDIMPEQITDGIRFTPMEFSRGQPAPILPDTLGAVLDGYTCIKNNIGCSSAGVYKYSRGIDSLYLKIDRSGGELLREYDILCWLDGKLPVPKIKYLSEHAF